jgi:hypothetical protein
LEVADIDGRILTWALKDGDGWTGWLWVRIGQVASDSECDNEHSGFIKCGEFHVYLRNC